MYRYQTRFAWKVSILENDTIDIVSNIPVSFIYLGNGPPFSRQLSGATNDGFLLSTLKTLLGYPEYMLGDPGADSGGEGKSKRAEK